MVMDQSCHWRPEAGNARDEMVKMSSLHFLLVVLQVGQDPSGWCQDGQCYNSHSNDIFLDGQKDRTNSSDSQSADSQKNRAVSNHQTV